MNATRHDRPLGVLKATTMLALALSLLVASTAAAAARPSVSLTVPAQADAGKPTALSFTAKRVPSSASLYLQRQQGTARTWRTVARLHGPKGSLSLPALAMGVYHVRAAAISKLKGRKLLAVSSKSLSVFGSVPLVTLLQVTEQTVSSSTNTFSYVFQRGGNYPTTLTVSAASNECRSVHLDFEAGVPSSDGLWSPSDPRYPVGETATLAVLQQSADPVAVTTAPATLAAVDAKLVVGQSWGVHLSSGPRDFLSAFVNGSASCTSTGPLLTTSA